MGGIRVYWDAGPAMIEGDAARLAQALDNLISNALEHGGPPVVITGARVAGRTQDHHREQGPPRRAGPRDRPAARPRDGGRLRGGQCPWGRFALCQTGSGCVAALELPLAEPGYARAA